MTPRIADRVLLEAAFRCRQVAAWASDAGLINLLTECEQTDECYLLSKLLERFEYLDACRFDELIESGLNALLTHLNCNLSEMQFVAATVDTAGDSAQSFLNTIKYKLARKGIHDAVTVNSIRHVRALRKQLSRRPHVIIVDDFLGTGQTMESRYRSLSKSLRDACATNTASQSWRLTVFSAVAMEQAVRLLVNRRIDHCVGLTLKKGIAGHVQSGAERAEEYLTMIRMENRLARKCGDVKRPRFGHRGSQTLYAIDKQCVPNNVFPIFWWPATATNEPRNTLLARSQQGLSANGR